MKTFKRICIKDYTIEDDIGQKLELKRGKEYTTSSEINKKVVVFSTFWVRVPVKLFAGEQVFTAGEEVRGC